MKQGRNETREEWREEENKGGMEGGMSRTPSEVKDGDARVKI